jgi:hypothetical protein
VLVSSLFSNATFFPITWMLIAITLAELNARKPDPEPTDSAEQRSAIAQL